LTLALVLSLIPAPALRVPKTALRSPGDRQVGRRWSSQWTNAQGEFCQTVIADGIPNYERKPMTWRSHRKIHLRLFKRHKPTRLVIRMYRRLGEYGPVGKGRRADYRLRRSRAWIAGFNGPRKANHLYLAVHVEYKDVEGCGGTQSMELAFHLLRRAKT
jgi:hypothetical protein